MAAATLNNTLTESYALVATAAVRLVVRATKTATVRIVPTGAAAPDDSDVGVVFACPEAFDFGALGSACDVYAKGDGKVQSFSNTV